MILFSNAMRNSPKFNVISRNVRFDTLSGTSFLTAIILSSFSDFAKPVLKLVCFVNERPHDVVKMLYVFGSISSTDVADQCFIC